MSNTNTLFEPLKVGAVTIRHRIAMAPLTRMRASDEHVPTDMMVEYYSQRASEPGTLLITEGTFIAARVGGIGNVPGIWNDEQIAGWKKVVDAVHEKGSFIFLQMWALGRSVVGEALRQDVPDAEVVSSGNIPRKDYETPRPLTLQEIDEYVAMYAQAAKNAVFGSGFDGVEIHGANGYLIDQFIKATINNRTDEYGGSIEGRLRFPLRVVDAVAAAVGADRTGIRLSPWERWGDSFMPDPVPTFSQLVKDLALRELAYLHVIESHAASLTASSYFYNPPAQNSGKRPDRGGETLDFASNLWAPRPMILVGGFTPELARTRAEEAAERGENIIVGFGRFFISNPDLPTRVRKHIPFSEYDRSTFYAVKQSTGYTDYPFAE